MSTSIEHEPAHLVVDDPNFPRARARIGVLLLMLADAVSILSVVAAGGFLNALNTEGKFREGASGPVFLPGLLLAVALALSGISYFLWYRGQKNGGGGQRIVFIVSWVLMVAALAFQIWVGVALRYDGPLHAYESLILLITWYSVFHLVLTAIIGVLVFGRIVNGRLAAFPYIAEVVGYWWYYTVIAGLLMWLFSVLI